MKHKEIQFSEGSSSIERKINAIAGTDTSGIEFIHNSSSGRSSNSRSKAHAIGPPQEETIKMILTKSFMSHQKGQKREFCSLGHHLEKLVLKNLISLI